MNKTVNVLYKGCNKTLSKSVIWNNNTLKVKWIEWTICLSYQQTVYVQC
jgi:hypothetical protein